MKITIHRGSHAIGGTCIELADGDTRIILDLGMPLMASGGGELSGEAVKDPSIENGILPNVAGLYTDQAPSVDAVILSHAHLDHYGLMDYIHPDIPVYMSSESKDLLEVGSIFYPESLQQNNVQTHTKTFRQWTSFKVGAFEIKPYLMDHSAFGGSAFLIAAEGKQVFYTGDFRGHGRSGALQKTILKDPITDVDALLLEGTTLGGKHYVGFDSEEAVENELFSIFASQKDASFVTAAGSNIDRLVSVYKAAMRAKKTLVIDLYQLYMLEKLKAYSPGLPPHEGDQLRVLYLHGHAKKMADKLGQESLYKHTDRKINQDEILKNRDDMVLKLPLFRMDLLAKEMAKTRSLENAHYIYSMWNGYLDRDPQFNAFCEKHGIPLSQVHTSGHAYLSTAQDLVKALNPKAIIPIHTLSGDEFQEHFPNVVRLKDGEQLAIN